MAGSLTVKLRLHLGPAFHSSAVVPLAPQSFEVVKLRVVVEMARGALDSGAPEHNGEFLEPDHK